MAEAARVPVVLHLDHGQSLEDIRRALEAGFSSVMIDGSHLPLEENITLTRQAARMAHAVGVSLEGELGQIGGKEEEIVSEGLMTDPETVPYFVEATGLDVLAVSFGSAHQKTTRDTQLDLPRLERIAAATPLPLVLHGGSGVPADMLRAATARAWPRSTWGPSCSALSPASCARPCKHIPRSGTCANCSGPASKPLHRWCKKGLRRWAV